ncbi:MAG: aminotransferase [Clostridiaceae bacterium]
MKNSIDVYIKVDVGGKIPQYASKHAAGCDLYATEDMVIRPGETKIMPLNFIMALDADMEAQIRPRSGLSLKTELRIPNGPGTVDSDYRDTVGVILQNIYNIANLPYQIAQSPDILEELYRNYKEVELRDYLTLHRGIELTPAAGLHIAGQKIYIDDRNNPYGTIYIKKGERIAQMIFCRYERANFILHPDPKEIGEDRGGGFGHTGKG